MKIPALTMAEARVLYEILNRTWIPVGPKGETFKEAVKKLERMAESGIEPGGAILTPRE